MVIRGCGGVSLDKFEVRRRYPVLLDSNCITSTGYGSRMYSIFFFLQFPTNELPVERGKASCWLRGDDDVHQAPRPFDDVYSRRVLLKIFRYSYRRSICTKSDTCQKGFTQAIVYLWFLMTPSTRCMATSIEFRWNYYGIVPNFLVNLSACRALECTIFTYIVIK